eukprot:Skav219716  [mRNA]  locus=scaffold301:31513:32607:+ [translate_table: standard]
MCLTPDLEVCRHDLNVLQHQVLSRACEFPPEHQGNLYCFDPVSRATLESKKRIAVIQAQILGDEDPGEAIAYVWVVAEKSHAQYGEVVAEDMMNDPSTGVAFEQKGVTTIDGEEVFVQRMASSEVESFKKKTSDDEQDLRLLGVHKDRSGKRKLDLNDSLTLMKETTLDDFPLSTDVRAAKEFLTAVNDGPGNLQRYHTEWQRLSGIADGSSVCHAHRIICETLRLMHSYDQLNIANLASGEQLVRWLVQLETATERNFRSPDFTGLDLILGGAISAEGKALTQKFTEHLSSKLKERASIWKQERLYREERKHLLGGGPGGAAASDPYGGGKGKGKGKGGRGKTGAKAKAKGGRGSEAPAAESS